MELCDVSENSEDPCRLAGGISKPSVSVGENSSYSLHVPLNSDTSAESQNVPVGTAPKSTIAESAQVVVQPPIITRAGRTVRAPVKMDL